MAVNGIRAIVCDFLFKRVSLACLLLLLMHDSLALVLALLNEEYFLECYPGD